jgi:hypothetical protein
MAALDLAVAHASEAEIVAHSTSAIAGNLLGAQLGERAIPHNWLERLELRNQIAQVAELDIHAAATGGLSKDADWGRYPGC